MMRKKIERIKTNITLFFSKLLPVSVKDERGNSCGDCDLCDFPCGFVNEGCPIGIVRKFRWRKNKGVVCQ
jgi:hypothetical protein